MTKIPLIDLQLEYRDIKKEIDEAIKKVLLKGNFILSEEVEFFEKGFAKYCGAKYAVGVSSGTDALELALRSLGISYGDFVVVPTLTFYSTASAVCYVGARPIFVDVEEQTGNIDVEKLELALKKNRNKKIKAVIPVHLYGNPARIDKILELAKRYGIYVIEDSCQAHGAEVRFRVKGSKYKVKKVGSIGDLGCFSFYPIKNLGCYGDGGAVVTNNKRLAEKIKFLRDYGRKQKYVHLGIGYNKRLDTIQAAILSVKLKYLDERNQKRREIAKIYSELLKDVKEVRPIEVSENSIPVYHCYVCRAKRRDELRKFLYNKGIETGIHYPLPLHLQPAFKFLGYKKGDFPVSEKLASEVISLPMYPEISLYQVEYICGVIKKFYE